MYLPSAQTEDQDTEDQALDSALPQWHRKQICRMFGEFAVNTRDYLPPPKFATDFSMLVKKEYFS